MDRLTRGFPIMQIRVVSEEFVVTTSVLRVSIHGHDTCNSCMIRITEYARIKSSVRNILGRIKNSSYQAFRLRFKLKLTHEHNFWHTNSMTDIIPDSV